MTKIRSMKSQTAAGAIAVICACLANGVMAGDIGARPAVQVEPEIITGPLLAEPPTLTPVQRAQREHELDRLWQQRRAMFTLPVDPTATPAPVTSPPTLAPQAGSPPTQSAAGNPLTLYRNTLMTDAFTNNQTSSTNEPTTGANGRVIFYAGNWYASVSTDHGQTFSYINPYTNFADPPTGGFCCDQVVYYERTRGIMCWYLQYVQNAQGNNAIRIAVSTSQQNLANNVWHTYTVTPQDFGYDDGVNFDFPDLSASSNFLYATTNIGGASDNAIVMRLDLDDLASASSVTFNNFTSSLPNLRATHGATGTMYVGTQVDNDTLRIYEWPESSGSPTSVDRDVNMWFTVQSVANSPDGTNWIGRDFHDILASWTGGGRVGFMWGSAQGGAFPWPNVRFARFFTSTLNLADQGTIWSTDTAWGYAAAHPNDRGDVGGTIAFGGGGMSSPYPSVAAWAADFVNGDTIAPLEAVFVSAGDSGPASNRWGDYFTSRRHVQYGNTWAGTGFVLNGGQGGGAAEPRYLWFGRDNDEPPSSHTIYADLDNASGYETGASNHPYNTVEEGEFATVPGDTLIIRSGSYDETLTFSRQLTVRSEGGTAVVGQ